MTLRVRLVLTTLVAGLPALLALWVVSNSIKDARDDDLFGALVLAHFSSAKLSACEASPPTAPTGIPLPPLKRGVFRAFGDATELVVFTYDQTGHSSQPDAPDLPQALLEKLRGNPVQGGTSLSVTMGGNRRLLLALPREQGPCALALVATQRLGPPGPPPADLFVPIALALFAGLISIWPVVRRIRSMTRALHRWDEGAPLALPRDVGRDELSELSRALTDSAETIRRQHDALVAREKTLLEFIENTTHDLATPLTVLQGNLSAIANQHSPEAVRQAMDEAQYIGALLGNLAISPKFEAAAQVDVRLDLGDVVLRVVDRHRTMASWLGVAIERSIPDEHVFALGDPTFTERALSNLVENAMRHNVRGGHVAVVLELEGNEFALRVLDDGPGLAKEECERILAWDEGKDAARSRQSAGGGLGLSIVARVAQIQRWRFALKPGESGGLVAELRGAVT
jgi:signal transduction histidine kinase